MFARYADVENDVHVGGLMDMQNATVHGEMRAQKLISPLLEVESGYFVGPVFFGNLSNMTRDGYAVIVENFAVEKEVHAIGDVVVDGALNLHGSMTAPAIVADFATVHHIRGVETLDAQQGNFSEVESDVLVANMVEIGGPVTIHGEMNVQNLTAKDLRVQDVQVLPLMKKMLTWIQDSWTYRPWDSIASRAPYGLASWIMDGEVWLGIANYNSNILGTSADYQTNSELYKQDEAGEFIWMQSVATSAAIYLLHWETNGQHFLVFINNRDDANVLRNSTTGLFETKQFLPTSWATAAAHWNKDDTDWLVVLNSKIGTNFTTTSDVYCWNTTTLQMDHVQSLLTIGASAVVHWEAK